MNRREPAIGIVIIAAGLFILLGKWGFFSFLGGTLWPLFVFLAGVALFVLIRFRMLPAVAFVPAGALLVYGLLFMLCHWISWGMFAYLWPFIPFGLAFGLFGYCQLDPYADRRVYMFAIALAGISIVLLLFTLFVSLSVYLIAIFLIVVGVFLVFGNRFGLWRR
ncbi:glutamate synthase [Paenibacillus sp. 1001270B_150601_E10]|uniref:glutamate synthase n=1 Tax=Paenibacillus sp. 1001270B_150601_E10 TaxID=2787079 RepID=UPI001E5BA2A5|nr:glutamate synthase [Paenibacillus sp. 1001270B_150601_E10]